jgi:ATP-dependent exoDNAse (exonuclease V) beta subunit
MSEPVPLDVGHRRLKASAGSGKTWRLVLRAVELLDAGAPVDSLLAATFTRNAAGEIRDRILARLCEAASTDAAAASLQKDLEKHRTLPERRAGVMTRDRAGMLLRRLAREVHRLQVRTLDGFLAAMVGAFPAETGVPPGVRIAEDSEDLRLRADAIEQLLADERHGDAIVRLLRTLTQGRADSGVDRLIDTTVREAWSVFRESSPAAWQCFGVPAGPDDAAVTAARGALEAALVGAPSRLRKAGARIIELVDAGQWKQIARSGPAKNIAAGDPTFYKVPIPPEFLAPITLLLQRARHEMRREIRERTEAMAEVCARLEVHLDELKRIRGCLSFDDLVLRLRPLAAAEGGPDFDRLAWRLDAGLEHMLLDEFQDTSVGQWEVLRPIAARLVEDLTDQRTLFVVGDVKQSIYGWRSGRPEILEHLPTTLLGDSADLIVDEPLKVSWRSSPVILETVNTAMQRLSGNPAVSDSTAGAIAAAHWDEAFRRHEAAEKHEDLPGWVEVRTGAADASVPAGPARQSRHGVLAIAEAVRRVEQWHRAMPEASIGVLVRTRAAGEQVIQALRRADPPVAAIGKGGRPLVEEPAVTAVLSLLHLADHPDDRAAAFHVAEGPLGPIVGFPPGVGRDPRRLRREAADVSARIRDRLAEDGLAATVGWLVGRLADACDASQVRRLQHLRELAAQLEGSLGPRPTEFVAAASLARAPEPARGTVSVLTIHASKGLEFDLVVLTDLAGRLDRSEPLLVDRDPEDGRVRSVRTRVGKDDRWILEPEEIAAEDHASAARIREAFCLSYVAMTRARQGLSIVLPAPSLRGDGGETFPAGTLHGLIRGGLELRDPPPPSSLVWSSGCLETLVAHQRAAAASAAASAIGGPAAEGPGRWRLRPPTRPRPVSAAAAAKTAEATVPLGRRLRPSDREPRDRGTAIHAMLEAIRWLDAGAGPPDAEAAAAIVRAAVPRRPEAWARAQAAELPAILARPSIASLLRLDGRDPDRVTVDLERPWARIDERGVQQGFIDRVEFERDADGAVGRVRIIDWKTDHLAEAASEAEVREHLDRYAPQIQAYREVMAAATGLDPAAIEAVLAFTGSGRIVPVPPGA